MKTVAVTILVLIVLASGFGMAPATAMAADSTASDWPQWRGPNRDGVAGPGPKLADAWPKEGPKLLWKSDPIPCGFNVGGDAFGGVEGGMGSVTVVGQRAFVYVHGKTHVGTVAITAKILHEWAWMEGVPDDLGRKVDQLARKPIPGPKKDRDALVKEFLATLDPKLAEKYAPWVEKRVKYMNTAGSENRSWDNLVKLATIIDKPFPTFGDLMKEFQRLGFKDPGGFFYSNANENVDNRLYAMPYKFADTIVCLDASTGKELWKKEFPGAPSTQGCYIGASGTPAVWDGKCYASGSAGVYCLSVADGSVVWQAKTKFTNSSPLVADGGVFLMFDKGLTAFDALTGKLLWTQPKVRGNCTSVTSWTSGGKTLIVTNGCAYSTTDGREVWRAYDGRGGYSTPIISGDIMVDPNAHTMHAVKLTDGKAELLWTRGGGTDNCGSSSLVYQGYMYQPSHRYMGVSKCRDAQTGELKWQIPLSCQCTSTIAADGKIFYTHDFRTERARKPRLIMFKATPEKFELLGMGSDTVPEGCTPSIANGRLYVRLKDCVACYDITAAGNPPGVQPKPAVADVESKTTSYVCKNGGDIFQALSAVDKGDSLEITDKNGKVTTRKKSDIYDVIKPGMTWQIR